MTNKRMLNMLKSIHSPLSRIAILGLIAFGTIVGSTKISRSDNSPSSPGFVPSEHPFQPKVRVSPKQVTTYIKKTGRPIKITSIVGNKNLANENEQTCIVYSLRDEHGVVKYVGKASLASAKGIPSKIMAGRLGNHNQIKNRSDLEEARIEIQGTKSNCEAFEDAMLYWYKRNGAQMLNTNRPIDPKKSNYPKIDEKLKKGEPIDEKDLGKADKKFKAMSAAIDKAKEVPTTNSKNVDGSPIFTPPATKSSSNATVSSTGLLPQLLSGAGRGGAAKSALGGIDFSTLELRYIAEDSSPFADRGLKYAFNGTPTASNKNLKAGRIAAVQASDAFFVWLSLSPDKFWVNLNPNEPDRIIDEQFGKTDAGRILLQADLRMKKTVAQLIHPDTLSGKQFWQQLKNGSSGTCLSFRQWIVPAPATVRKEGNGIYIADAPLNVKLESQYFQSKGALGLPASCAIKDKSIEAYNESIFRKLILPRVEKAVNKAPEYADLRRVYRSRVAAEWYRQRSASNATTYREMVNNGDVSSWPARQNWLPRQVFKQYVNSFTKGEFHVVHSHQWQDGNTIYTQKQLYVYGGVDFTRIFFKQLNSIDFQKKWGDLHKVVDTSMKSPVADQNGKIWLGGSAVTGKAIWKTIWFYLALGFLALPLLIRWKRLYRKRVL